MPTLLQFLLYFSYATSSHSEETCSARRHKINLPPPYGHAGLPPPHHTSMTGQQYESQPSLNGNIDCKRDSLKTDRLKTGRLKTDRLKTDRLKTDRLKTGRLKTDRLKRDRLKMDRLKTDRLKTDRLKTDSLKTDKLKIDRLKTDRLKTVRLKTDIQIDRYLDMDNKINGQIDRNMDRQIWIGKNALPRTAIVMYLNLQMQFCI